MRRALCVAVAVIVAMPLGAQSSAAPASPAPVRAPTDGQILFFLQNMPASNARAIGPVINALLSDTTSHMRMLDRRAGTAGDSLRAAAIVRTMRTALQPYTDVTAAERDGYALFLPWLDDQIVYHYNNLRNAGASATSFDATKPTSLLYRKDAAGGKVLVGAMYTAPASSTAEELDGRLPTSVAFWHQHVNFCAMRPAAAVETVQHGDSTVFAKWLALETPESCSAAGGLFIPRLFGWMAHVNAFDGDDPGAIWGAEGKDHMHMHHGH